jgi:carbon starvation protein
MLILAVSAFCLTSLDTATRLARYMFQEFWLNGKSINEAEGTVKVLSNPYVATVITVILGIGLGMTGYANIWSLFGAANQLLAALGLLAVASWLGKLGRNNKMFFIPMIFMLVVTLTSLVMTIQKNLSGAISGAEGAGWMWIRGIIAILLVVLAVILAIEGIQTISKQIKEKKAA